MVLIFLMVPRERAGCLVRGSSGKGSVAAANIGERYLRAFNCALNTRLKFRLLYLSLSSSFSTGRPRLWKIRMVSPLARCRMMFPAVLRSLLKDSRRNFGWSFRMRASRRLQAFAILEFGLPLSVRFQKGFPSFVTRSSGISDDGRFFAHHSSAM